MHDITFWLCIFIYPVYYTKYSLLVLGMALRGTSGFEVWLLGKLVRLWKYCLLILGNTEPSLVNQARSFLLNFLLLETC